MLESMNSMRLKIDVISRKITDYHIQHNFQTNYTMDNVDVAQDSIQLYHHIFS